jgi:6-phosphogluconolactonase
MATMLRRRDFIAGLAGVAAAGPLLAAQSGTAGAGVRPRFMYVGCFTTKDRGHGDGLSVFEQDAGKWKLVQVLREIVNPSYLFIDRNARFLYSVEGVGTQVTAYRIDEKTGKLTVLNQQSCGGKNPVHLAIDATGRFVVTANYNTGSIAALPINADGSLAPVSDLVSLTGFLDPGRKQISQPHHCPFDPTGRFVVVPDNGQDKVFVYRLDTATGKLVDGKFVVARNGSAPRHAGFHPTKPFAYVLNEQDSTVAAYRFEPQQQKIEPFQILTTLPSSYTGNNTTAEISVAPSGRFLYGSNRGHDSIAAFAIDQSTGALTPAGWESTQGRTPRFAGLDPSGTQFYAANEATDTVVAYRVDSNTGKLTPTGEILSVKTPVTIVFK